MKSTMTLGLVLGRRLIPLFAIGLAFTNLLGCSSGGGNTATATDMPLYRQLGRADGAAKLADLFGANIASNPLLNSTLDATTIESVKTGLTNDIIKVSGMTPPSSTTLESALAGKNLGEEGLTALSSCLTAAGTSMNLGAATIESLSALLKPLSKSVSGK
jgi:hypothetical protein